MSRGNGAAPPKKARKASHGLSAVRYALRALAGSEVSSVTLLPQKRDARAVVRFLDGSAKIVTTGRSLTISRDQTRAVSRALGAPGRPL